MTRAIHSLRKPVISPRRAIPNRRHSLQNGETNPTSTPQNPLYALQTAFCPLLDPPQKNETNPPATLTPNPATQQPQPPTSIPRSLDPSIPSSHSRLAHARRILESCQSRWGSSWRSRRRLATGLAELDDLLGGGIPLGAVCDIASEAEGLGATSLALRVAAAVAGDRRAIFLVDPRGCFYPPAVAGRWGIELERLVIVRRVRRADALWAVEQALRCTSVAAVVGLLSVTDTRCARRLQLAAEAGGGVGLLVHPDHHNAAASFISLRLRVCSNTKKTATLPIRQDRYQLLSL